MKMTIYIQVSEPAKYITGETVRIDDGTLAFFDIHSANGCLTLNQIEPTFASIVLLYLTIPLKQIDIPSYNTNIK